MTHEAHPRPTGYIAGPEHDHTLPDADDVPVYPTLKAMLDAEQSSADQRDTGTA